MKQCKAGFIQKSSAIPKILCGAAIAIILYLGYSILTLMSWNYTQMTL